MSNYEYFPPVLGYGEYHCPHPDCGVYAKQHYAHLVTLIQFDWVSVVDDNSKFNEALPEEWVVTKCQRCKKHSIWLGEKLLFPKNISAPPPNSDLSEDIKSDYLEAAAVLSDSPRAAAALLRLALQKLCLQLGESGSNINQDIKSMVSKGLNPLVQKSLDALRLTGNNAVHPGEINLEEDHPRVLKLFELLNFVADKMLTEPKEIESFYEDLPEGARDQVRARDKQG